ncbi:antibiotic biosynthesis monooxygenase [Magnetovibrio sp.]|uniref:antibiotic biosynthesis monooxygenase n=1 Tax=Magnetovibrio sp. TaxID=2024836 RepID=UPI002F91C955
MDSMTKEQAASAPVTVSVARRILPGREQDYEDWITGVSVAAAKFTGHQGINIIRPNQEGSGEYVLIYRFDSYEHGRAWEESDVRAFWMAKLDGMAEGEATYKKVTGLEFWFDLPVIPIAARPSPHKMALILVITVFLLVYPMQAYVGPLMGDIPLWAKVFCVVLFQVLMLTYVVMPRVTKLLKSWLYTIDRSS